MGKTYSYNRKARFDYEFLQTYEAGIKLLGHEVKSIKKGSANLQGSFVIIRGGEAYITNFNVPPYQEANLSANYDPERPRKLLLNKKELAELAEASTTRGLTIVPIKLYNKKGLIKLEFALARGKKKYDKRQTIKKRDIEREVKRKLK